MSGVNKVIIVGNLGADPEVKFVGKESQAVANFRIATTESWTDKAGQKQSHTEWVHVVVWGKLAELCGQYLKKGRQAYVEGKLRTREYTDKAQQRKWVTEVVAETVTFLGSNPRTERSEDAAA